MFSLVLRRSRSTHPPLHSFTRSFTRTSVKSFDLNSLDRPEDDVDVCIVGAGPAGLSAAIRLKQLSPDLRVVVLEKGPDVGAHILSGAVIEPRALDELLPDWRTRDDHPLTQHSTSHIMRFLTPSYAIPIPHPPQMFSPTNYVASLSRVTAWLGTIAEESGVEVYPGFAGAKLLYSEDGRAVQGVITHDAGLDRHFRPKSSFEPGLLFRSKITLLAEGAHGSLSKGAIAHFDLRRDSDPQTYGIGVKEVWRVRPEVYEPGKVIHTVGYPLDMHTYGGGWAYHMADGLVSLGLVIGLDYTNPYLSPYKELQRLKHHPFFSQLLEGGERIGYGARVLNEGGLQSVPRLAFPGGALVGCAAGFVNIAKIKGTHNAMKSGMLAAEAAYTAITEERVVDGSESSASGNGSAALDMSAYDASLRASWVWEDLKEVRNVRQSFNTPLGVWGGMAYSGIDTLLLKGRTPWTFRNKTRTTDAQHTKRASECQPISYPPPQPPLSTDILTSVSLTGTNHAEDQPVHLRLPHTGPSPSTSTSSTSSSTSSTSSASSPDSNTNSASASESTAAARARSAHVRTNVSEYAGLLGRACPAAVYEYVDVDPQSGSVEGEEEGGGWGGKKLVINSQNCIHCKLCDVKVPTQDINWTVPEGGGGPKYSIM